MILVVGASGFIGRALVALMAERGLKGIAVSRSGAESMQGSVRCVRVPGYEDRDALAAAATGCEAAIMLAGRAHVLREKASDSGAAFLHANREVPLAVADAFARAGGSRFVHVSSIAVNGIATLERAFSEADAPAPVDDYGRSKLAGEVALQDRCPELGLDLVIVRPPLVYGAGAPGNFGRLLGAARRGLPLPLASIRNRRDLVGVENLADLLLLCARHPDAVGRTFLASDGEEVSTAQIARALYGAAGHGWRLLPLPPALVRIAARAVGAERLLDDLRVDSSDVHERLGWRPPLTTAEGLARSVEP